MWPDMVTIPLFYHLVFVQWSKSKCILSGIYGVSDALFHWLVPNQSYHSRTQLTKGRLLVQNLHGVCSPVPTLEQELAALKLPLCLSWEPGTHAPLAVSATVALIFN